MSGLRGTGSHHFHVDDVVVPADAHPRAARRPSRASTTPIVRIPPPSLFALRRRQRGARHRPGRARRHRRRSPPTRCRCSAGAPLAAEPDVPARPGRRRHRAARGARPLLHDAADVDAVADARSPATSRRSSERARVRATAVWATARAVAVVDAAYRAGGGSARLRRQPAAAPAPRHPRGHPALPGPAGHADDGRRRPRRQRTRPPAVLNLPPRLPAAAQRPVKRSSSTMRHEPSGRRRQTVVPRPLMSARQPCSVSDRRQRWHDRATSAISSRLTTVAVSDGRSAKSGSIARRISSLPGERWCRRLARRSMRPRRGRRGSHPGRIRRPHPGDAGAARPGDRAGPGSVRSTARHLLGSRLVAPPWRPSSPCLHPRRLGVLPVDRAG